MISGQVQVTSSLCRLYTGEIKGSDPLTDPNLKYVHDSVAPIRNFFY